eukprot:m.93335 g.93335  ORF g.93335 m.93335 type:complete len:1568 (-) comp8910_c0_seq1:842-5545(-)
MLGHFLDRKFEELGAYLGRNPKVCLYLFLSGLALVIILSPGISVSEEEDRTEELYVHLKSRLPHQYDVLKKHWGGLTRSQLVIYENEEGETASKKAMDAMIASATPFWKEDETDLCSAWDGFVSSRPAECDTPAYANNIYCNCEEIAASPNQIYFELEREDLSLVNITMKDVCESPDVPPLIGSTDTPTVLPSEAGFLQSQYFSVIQSLLVFSERSHTSLVGSAGYSSGKFPAISAIGDAIVQHETFLANNALRQDLGASVYSDGYVAGIGSLGRSFSLVKNDTLNSDALVAMWSAYGSDPTTSRTDLIQAYNTVSGDMSGMYAFDTIATTVSKVMEGVTLLMGAISKGVLAARYSFATEGRYMSYAYAEYADCVSKYIVDNRTQILADVFDTVVNKLDMSENGMLDWDAAGIAAAKAVVQNSLGRGENPATNTTVQFLALVAFVSTATEPYASYLASKQNAFYLFDTDGVAAATPVAIGSLATQLSTGGSTFSPTDLNNIATAYVTAASNDTLASGATQAIAEGVGLAFSVGNSVVAAVVTGVLSSLRAPSLLLPDDVVLGGAIRPLPRGWGVDRFPCSRATGLDVFQEGDFDYPYKLKMLDRISSYMYYFTSLDMFSDHASRTQCLETRFTQPSKDGAYLNALDGEWLTYSAPNFPAFTAAEVAFDASIANGDSLSAAAAIGVNTFVANGGVRFDFTNSSNSFPLGSAKGLAFLATSSGQAFASKLGTAIATGASTATAINDQFPLIVQALFSFGYWYRPSYGSHPLSQSNLTTPEILAVFDDAITNTANPSITISECITHNTDSVSFLGDPVLGCFLAWSGSILPYELSLGSLEYDEFDNLISIPTQRIAGSNFAESHISFETHINSVLEKTTGLRERLNIHQAFEAVGIDYFRKLWNKDFGTGFAQGEKFGDQSLFFQMSRSVEDTIHEAAKVEYSLLIGGFFCLVVYLYLTSTNLRNTVYSHGWLAVSGVLVIVLSTFAALGLSAYLGVKFTPISTNVVPFIAVGVGVDDVLVVLAAFHNAFQRGHTSVESLMKFTLAESGASVTFTSLTNFIAFAIASAAPVLVVRLFCFQMLASIFLNWLFIMLIFIPLMYRDARRVSSGTPERMCTCAAPSHNEDNVKFTDSFFSKVFSPVILSPRVRIFVMVCFATCIGLSIWQSNNVELGTKISDIATKGDYLYDFATRLETSFTMYSGYFVTLTDDVAGAQQNLLDTVDNLQASVWVADSAPIASFYWLHSMLSQTTGSITPVSSAEFYPVFATWMSAFGVTSLNDLYCIDISTDEQVSCTSIVGAFSNPPATTSNANVRLVAMRGTYYIRNLNEIPDFVSAIESTSNAVKEIANTYDKSNDTNFESFAFGYVDLFYEQYVHTYTDLYTIVGSCLAGIFVITFIYQFSIVSSLIVCVIVFVVDLEVYALMGVFGIKLNAFSLTNLCLAIAMAIEFTAHLAHQYVFEDKDTRKEKAAGALAFMGTPLLNGFVSTAIALLFISNSQTEFIRLYYFAMFFSTIVVAFLNGIFVLPVLFSLFGPTNTASSRTEKLASVDLALTSGKQEAESEEGIRIDVI